MKKVEYHLAGLNVYSAYVARQILSAALGYQFDGRRDLYGVLGYPRELTFAHYYNKYDRQDIAARIVNLPTSDTWRNPPIISDSDSDTSQDNPKSKFIQSVVKLISKRQVWHYLQRIDCLAGIGRYGVLLIGVRGSSSLSTELKASSLKKVDDVIYLSVFDESSAEIEELEENPASERYGLPDSYVIHFSPSHKERVHWSRVIHVAEGLLQDNVYGRPRLKGVYNRLEDLEKIIGGGAEATWKTMDRGLHADLREGFTASKQDEEELSDEIAEYMNGLRRFIRTQGVDLKQLGSDVVDPTGLFNVVISLISAACGIPQRILLGSERGELASSQDQANWAGTIMARRIQFAEPMILRPFIDRLIYVGALPSPDSGRYIVKWKPLFELNELEKAQIVETYARAIAHAAPAGAPDLIVPPSEFREHYLGLPSMNESMLLAEELESKS